MQPENPPPLPPLGNPPPANYPVYTPPPSYAPPPPPRSGAPAWVWVLGGCVGCFFVFPILAAILFPVFAQAREKARESSCLTNVKLMGLSNMMYCQDYDDRFPMAETWQTDIVPYIKDEKIFHCPSAQPGTASSDPPATSYAFNSAMDMMKVKRLADPQNTVLTFDSTSFNRNANDALTSLPSPGRHARGNNLGFTDGHAKHWLDSESLPTGEILPDTP